MIFKEKINIFFDHYIDEFDFLIDSGIALGVKAVSDPKYPLNE